MSAPRPVPGEALLHPAPLAAAALLAANDLVLKRHAPGTASGKLSDLAINFLLPVALVAAAEWCAFGIAALRRTPFRRAGRGVALAACAVSAGYFALLKTWSPFTQVHAALLGALARPFGGPARFVNAVDPGDLLTLAATPLAAFFLLGRASKAKMATPGP